MNSNPHTTSTSSFERFALEQIDNAVLLLVQQCDTPLTSSSSRTLTLTLAHANKAFRVLIQNNNYGNHSNGTSDHHNINDNTKNNDCSNTQDVFYFLNNSDRELLKRSVVGSLQTQQGTASTRANFSRHALALSPRTHAPSTNTRFPPNIHIRTTICWLIISPTRSTHHSSNRSKT